MTKKLIADANLLVENNTSNNMIKKFKQQDRQDNKTKHGIQTYMYLKLSSIQADHQSLVRSGKKGHEEHHAKCQLPF